MSLCIDVDRVRAVLLADGWHDVATEGQCRLSQSSISTFEIDAYEFVQQGGHDRLLGGQEKHVAATGFAFTERVPAQEGDPYEYRAVFGPLTAILAVAYSQE